MDRIIFTEEFCQPEQLFPFTLTRQLQDIRVGILTIREKWERSLALPSFDKAEDDYKDLSRAIELEHAVTDGDCIMIHGNLLPDRELVKAVKKLKNGDCITLANGASVIFRFGKQELSGKHKITVRSSIAYKKPVMVIRAPWDIFQLNDQAIREDFILLTKGRKSASIGKSNHVVKRSAIFLEKGVSMQHCSLNASTGPIYIGRNCELMEGSVVRGPFAMGEGSVLKLGTKVYGATTLGPRCIAGGEIKNSVMFGFSNKAHDGYLGDSVLGEWCNMGAGTTNSNLKNNAAIVRVWTPAGLTEAGLKCGVLMGDYSRTAINTSINTGTVIGTCAHVSGSGLTPKYIPSFAWGSDAVERYRFEKALQDISNWKQLKGCTLTKDEETILKYLYQQKG